VKWSLTDILYNYQMQWKQFWIINSKNVKSTTYWQYYNNSGNPYQKA
jgi:hypothetical protein